MVYESGRWDNINIFRELKFAPEQHSEAARLRRIADYRIARTAPEPVFDEIVRLAASLFETPMACICIAEAHTHWYKASVGIDSGDMPRSTSFSDHALAGEGVLCVPDARQDPQFVNFPHVTDERQVRFVAVAPLIDSDGFKLGTILVQDRKPRQPLTGSQEAILASLARVTVNHMETRRLSMGLVEAEAQKAAAVVEEAHARLRDAIDLLPEGILIVDAEDRITLWNKRHSEMFPHLDGVLFPGMAIEALFRANASTSFGAYLEDAGSEAVEAFVAQRMAEHRARRDIGEWQLRDGRYLRYDQRPTPDGGAICIRVDITDLKQREETFRLLFAGNPLPMTVYDVATLKFLDANDAMTEHFGFSRDQVLDMTALDFRPPEYRARADVEIRANRAQALSGLDAVLVKADKSQFLATIYSRTLEQNGREARLAVIVDVTEQRRLAAQIKESEARAQAATAIAEAAHASLREVIELLPEAIVVFDAGDRLKFWNQKYLALFPELADRLAPGVPHETLLRETVISGRILEDADPETMEAWIAARIAAHRARRDIFEQKFSNGRYIRFDQRATSDGGAICIRVDITELRQREESFRALFDENPLPMLVYDIETLQILNVNGAAIGHFGFSREQFLCMTPLGLRPPEFRAEAEASLRARKGLKSGGDSVLWKADGSRFIGSSYSRTLDYQGHHASVTTTIDVTDQRRHEEQIRHVAHHDALSGLPNRLSFNKEIDIHLSHMAQTGAAFSLLLIDIDYFKKINDTLGHQIGDLLIIEVGQRLKNSIADSDFIARLGGDEFAIILTPAGLVAESGRISAMIAAMALPFDLNGNRVNCSISVGVTQAPQDGNDSTTLLQNADLALYRAKAMGRSRHSHFEPELRQKALGKRALERDLRRAVMNAEFFLQYQPMVEFNTRKIMGYEALLRWNHPKRGLLLPGEFMSADDNDEPFNSIGAWALAEACREATTWNQRLSLAVNLSPAQFRHGQIFQTVQDILVSSGLDPRRLELEITELLLLDHSPEVFRNLNQLRALGIVITMDDFGTGLSSLSSLPGFPIDKIKIDQSLVAGISNNLHSLEIIRAVMAVSNSLNIKVMAEGVETEGEFRALRELDCLGGQGYLFGRPKLVRRATDKG